MIKNDKINELKKEYDENKLSHIFLVETNNQSLLLSDLLELIKYFNCEKEFNDNCHECNLCHLIEENSLPTLKIIYPDGQAIKKEQMETLKNDFAYKPFISKYNIYVINEAEKFNQSSANVMLKFIEEPEKGIIGFLITNNLDNVISTIKSRCTLIKAYYEENKVLNLDKNLINNYISKIELERKYGIFYNKILLDENLEKNQIVDIFRYLLDFYQNLLNNKCEIEGFLEQNFSLKDILARINLVNKTLEKLTFNVNINLVLDFFVLSLEEL